MPWPPARRLREWEKSYSKSFRKKNVKSQWWKVPRRLPPSPGRCPPSASRSTSSGSESSSTDRSLRSPKSHTGLAASRGHRSRSHRLGEGHRLPRRASSPGGGSSRSDRIPSPSIASGIARSRPATPRLAVAPVSALVSAKSRRNHLRVAAKSAFDSHCIQ
jgi:hypothetical protein